MILGLSVPAFTLLHVIISLVAIAAGLVALAALTKGRWLGVWQAIFLTTTVATSVTGFFFHSAAFGPPHVIGVISLIDLAVALFALRVGRPAIYAVTATIALYLNVFVAVVQSFQKIGPLHTLAPAGTEPPFIAAQGLLLLAFAGLGFILVRRKSVSGMAAA
jgi:uncharacterized membrane protein